MTQRHRQRGRGRERGEKKREREEREGVRGEREERGRERGRGERERQIATDSRRETDIQTYRQIARDVKTESVGSKILICLEQQALNKKKHHWKDTILESFKWQDRQETECLVGKET